MKTVALEVDFEQIGYCVVLGSVQEIIFGKPVGFGHGMNALGSFHLEIALEFFEWDFVALVFVAKLFLDFFYRHACKVNILVRLVFNRVASNNKEPFVSAGRLVVH